MAKLIVYNSHKSTRRPDEYTTWFRVNKEIGDVILTNSGWMETKKELVVGTAVELPDNSFRFQPETFTGNKGEQITMNHIVAM